MKTIKETYKIGIEIVERFDNCPPWTGLAKVQYIINCKVFVAPIERPHAGTINPTEAYGDPYSLEDSWQINWEEAAQDYTEILICSREPIRGEYWWIRISRKPLDLAHNGLVKLSWCNPKIHRMNIFAPGLSGDGKAFDGPEDLYLIGNFHFYIRAFSAKKLSGPVSR